MSAGKRTAGPRGWWVDETLPELRDTLPAAIDAGQFCAWLGPVLGRYRNAMNTQAAFGPLNDELTRIRRLRRALRELLFVMRDGLPLRAEAELAGASLRHFDAIGMTGRDLITRVKHDSTCLDALLARVEQRLSSETPAPGRKPAMLRDALLHAIVHKLRDTPMAAKQAREIAAQVMIRCRIEVPDSERAIRRAGNKAAGRK